MQKNAELILNFSEVFSIPWKCSKNPLLEDFQTVNLNFELPQRNQVHLWLVNLEGLSYKKWYSILSKDENEKLEKIIPTIERKLRSKSRIALRLLISLYLKIKPDSIVFNYGEFGKPELSLPNQKITFNLSHSENNLAVLIDSSDSIGVDIETRNSNANISLKLANRFFSEQEYLNLQALKGWEQEFLFNQLWTLKESVLKSNGKGIHLIDQAPDFSDLNIMHQSSSLNFFQKENYLGFTVYRKGLWISAVKLVLSIELVVGVFF